MRRRRGRRIDDATRCRAEGPVGRLAYLVTGARHLKDRSLEVRIQVDGTHWYQGKAACVLFGNV